MTSVQHRKWKEKCTSWVSCTLQNCCLHFIIRRFAKPEQHCKQNRNCGYYQLINPSTTGHFNFFSKFRCGLSILPNFSNVLTSQHHVGKKALHSNQHSCFNATKCFRSCSPQFFMQKVILGRWSAKFNAYN
jgi:hypothetical protein